MKTLKVSIPLGKDEKVSGVIAVPDNFQKDTTAGVILAHGAGNDMENPLIVAAADGLCRAGFLSLRFNFLYKEKGICLDLSATNIQLKIEAKPIRPHHRSNSSPPQDGSM